MDRRARASPPGDRSLRSRGGGLASDLPRLGSEVVGDDVGADRPDAGLAPIVDQPDLRAEAQEARVLPRVTVSRISSETPSEKYVISGSPERLSNARTARSGSALIATAPSAGCERSGGRTRSATLAMTLPQAMCS